jgi:putative glutamine amidotransferase
LSWVSIPPPRTSFLYRLNFTLIRVIEMGSPLIGLTSYRHLNVYGIPLNSITEAYGRAVSNAGAIPVMIPLTLPEDSLDELLERLDGILFTGGGDVHPERYGSQEHPLVDDVDSDRDRVEIHLLNRMLEHGLPFLGICRGLQVINVALGGTLYEDILDQRPNSLKHQYYPNWPRNYLAHNVQVRQGSQLRSLLGSPTIEVNSLHHQGIRKLATPLKATAFAPDGVIEAFELADHPFGMAVQWHPEWLQEHPPMQSIFRAFVQAADEKIPHRSI